MFIIIDLQSETPIYQQIRDQVVLGIADGELPPGTTLPTARQLAVEFGVNMHTIAKAYDLLRQEGFVTVARRRGTSVQPPAPLDAAGAAEWEGRLRVTLAEGRARGLDDDALLAHCRRILATFAPARRAAAEGERS